MTGAGGGSFDGANEIRILEIVLDKDAKPVYEPGQNVTGRVVLVSGGGNIRFRSLSVTLRGSARVHWIETKTSAGVAPERCDSETEYFNKKKFLIPATHDRHSLSEGRHEFEFKFHLPRSAQLATSFEGKFGSIRYFIKAELDQSAFRVHRSKKAFTVISPVDINTADMLASVFKEAEKALCCWPCQGGDVSMAVSTDRTGYCPGESVAIDAGFVNGAAGSRRITPEAVLCQRQTFTAGDKIRTKKTKFTALFGRPISNEDTWDALLLKIPPGISPSITNSKLIRVEYFVRVSLVIPGSLNLSVSLPVVIGTVPLMRTASPASLRPAVPIPLPSIVNNDNSTSNLDDPPPSYMECVVDSAQVDLVEAGDVSETSSLYGETRFVPLYRYVIDYHYQAPPEYAEIDPFPVPVPRQSRESVISIRTGEDAASML